MSFLNICRKLSTLRTALKPVKVNVTTSPKGTNVLSVKWNTNQEVDYPAVWLRDNCQCPKCYQKTAMARLSLMRNLNVDIDIPKAEIINQDQIKIKWEDGHESHYNTKFLAKYGPQGTSADHFGHSGEFRKLHLWKSDYQIERFDFQSIKSSKDILYNWLNALYSKGLAIIENVPTNMNGLPSLIKTAFLPPEITHYGDYFRVEQKFDANNIAYTGATIGLHRDLPFYANGPGVQLLHCIEQFKGQGGENEFTDGFAVANYIRENHPKEWKILTTYKCGFSDLGYDEASNTTFYKIRYSPNIELNSEGEMIKINYNNQVRSRAMTKNVDDTKDFYSAMKLYDNLLYSNEYMLDYKLKEGECVTFDNLRVLHGRKGFEATQGSSRLYHGCYINWCEIKSRMNAIKFMDKETEH